MRYRELIVILMVLIPQLGFSQTNVGGIIDENTTWSLDKSPYAITENTLINSGVTLTINPGVTIEITNNKYLKIEGTLVAIGTSEEQITFTGSNWDKIWVANTSVSVDENEEYISGTILKYCQIKNGKIGIYTSSGSFLLDNCQIYDNDDGLSFLNANEVIIRKNQIYSNGNGVNTFSNGGNVKTLSNSIFRGNIIHDNDNIGLKFGGYLINSTNNLFIDNEIFRNSTGMYFNSGDVVSGFRNNIISKNKIYENTSQGIYISDDNNIIVENLIYKNAIGVNTDHGDNNLNISKNVFLQNDLAILLQRSWSGGKILFNNFIDNNKSLEVRNYCCGYVPRNFEINYNNFELQNSSSNANIVVEVGSNNNFESNNFIQKEEAFEVRNSIDINAASSYWGTESEEEISDLIIDFYDNFEKGEVLYSPFLNTPNTLAPIRAPSYVYKGRTENGTSIIWETSSNSDISGYNLYYNKKNEYEYSEKTDVGSENTYVFLATEIVPDTIVITSYDLEYDGINDIYEGHESWFSSIAIDLLNLELVSSSINCISKNVIVDIKSNYSFSDNQFILQLSDVNGSFENAVNLDTITVATETLSSLLPDTLQYGELYNVRVFSTELNVFSESLEVIPYQVPTSSFELSSSICFGDNATVTYNGNSSIEAVYSWNFDGGNIISGNGQGPYVISWNQSGDKTVSLEVAENGCTSSISENIISINSELQASFTTNTVVCENETLLIEFNGIAPIGSIYNWELNGGNIVSQNDSTLLEVEWTGLGQKEVSLSIALNGCISNTQSKLIEYNPIPSSSFESNSSICSSENATITYTGASTVDATYLWNFNGGSIISGNGQGPYNISWNQSGDKTISLEVVENGCSSITSRSINIIKTPTNDFAIQEFICEDETAIVTYTGNGDATATYSWDFDGGKVISGEGMGPYEISWDTFGTKNVSLSVLENDCESDINNVSIEYNQFPTLSFEAEKSVCYNENYQINFIGDNYTIVSWEFNGASIISGSGTGPYSLKWDASGQKFIGFSAFNGSCMVDTTIVVNIPSEPYTPEICMVTVDEESLKNMLVWSYDLESIDQFGIYRETNVSGDYALVEYMDGEQTNSYIDNQSSPDQQSNRYKITSLDSCGTETALSNFHKTIHLTINKGLGNDWNLIWDGYEGFSFGTYQIYKSLDGGDFELLTEIASNLSSFTDTESTTSDVAYQIVVLTPNECEINDGGRKQGVANSTRSNIARNNTVTGISDFEKSIKLYPNPTSEYINIELGSNLAGKYYLYDFMGRVIVSGTLTEENKIDLTNEHSGTYLLTIITNNGYSSRKIVKM